MTEVLGKAFTEHPSGKFTIEPPNPISTPGQCATCGTIRCEQGFINPGLDFEFYGTLIFCRTCVSEMAAMYGLISAEQAEQYQMQTETYRKGYLEVLDQLEAAKRIIDGYSSNWIEHRSSTTSNVSADAGEPVETVSGESLTIKLKLPGRQQQASESGSGEGLFKL